jgi:hypothetical protein
MTNRLGHRVAVISTRRVQEVIIDVEVAPVAALTQGAVAQAIRRREIGREVIHVAIGKGHLNLLRNRVCFISKSNIKGSHPLSKRDSILLIGGSKVTVKRALIKLRKKNRLDLLIIKNYQPNKQ